MQFMRRSAIGLVAVACAAGCFSDLSGVKVDKDLGSSERDASVGHDGGGGGDDGGGQSGDDMKGAVDKTCALPHLQVAVRDEGFGTLTNRVLRIPLDGRPPCAPLLLAGQLPAPSTIGWLAPDITVLGEDNGRIRFIAQDDTEAAAPYNPGIAYSPTQIFRIVDESNAPHLAIAYNPSSGQDSSTPYRIDVLDAVDYSQRIERWFLGTDSDDVIRLQGAVAIDTDPRDAKRVLVLSRSAGKDVTDGFALPWDGMPVFADPYLDSLDKDDVPWVMRTGKNGALMQTAWSFTGNPNSSNPNEDRVVLRTEESGKAAKQWGPVTCVNNTMCYKPLSLADVIPDFSTPGAVIATCYVDDSPVTHERTSNVIRIAQDGTCTTLYRGDTLPERSMLYGLVAATE